jgi:hypothetical protein
VRLVGWLCGEVGVLAPEVVEEYGEGFGRVVEWGAPKIPDRDPI